MWCWVWVSFCWDSVLGDGGLVLGLGERDVVVWIFWECFVGLGEFSYCDDW